MGTIYDAVDVAAIPADATAVLAYIDGGYMTWYEVKARFPNALVFSVTTNGRNRADICDCESGDATPEVAAAGVRAGLYQTVYSDISEHGDLVSLLGSTPWSWYAAHPTGTPHLVPGSVATQWAWPGYGSPGNYDISDTNGIWPFTTPGPHPAPTPTPIPAPPPINPLLIPRRNTMDCNVPTGGSLVARPNGGVYAFDGATYCGSAGQVNPKLPPGGANAFVPAAPIVGIASTASGKGYWMVGADGGIFNFGDAPLLGPAPKYLSEWGIGYGHGVVPIIGIIRGDQPGIAYTIIADSTGPTPSLYRIPENGSLKQ